MAADISISDPSGRAVRIVILLVAAVLSFPSLAISECCLPEVLTGESWPANYTSKIVLYHLRVDAIGGVYFSWCGESIESSFVASKDDGNTWGRVETFRDSSIQVPEMEVSSNGTVVLLYLDEDFDLVSRTSFDQGDNFGSPVLVDTPPGFTFQGGRFVHPAQLSLDDSGLTVAAWGIRSPDEQGQLDPDAGIYVAFSADFGMNWAPAQRIALPSTAEPNVNFPSICIGQEGEEVVVSDTENPRALADQDFSLSFALRTTDRGANWSPPHPLDQGRSHALWCTSSGPGSHQALTYEWPQQAVDSARLRTIASQDGGSIWEIPGQAQGWNLALRRPHILGVDSGRTYLAWRDANNIQLQFSRSRAGGVNGTWLVPPSRPAPLAEAPTHVWLLPLEDGPLDIYYKQSPGGGVCPSGICAEVLVNRSCDEGSTWEEDSLRLDDDSEGLPLSEAPQSLQAPSGRIHAAWVDRINAQAGAELRYRALESPVHTPTHLTPEQILGDCGEIRYRLVSDEVPGDCVNPIYRWWRDNQELEGRTTRVLETESGLDGDYTYRVRIDCGPGSCYVSSEDQTFTLVSPRGEVGGVETQSPIRVAKTASELRLYWSETDPAPEGYNLYRGDFRQLHDTGLYNHAGVQCHELRSPPGANDIEIHTPSSGSNSYYLVVPADCGSEGIAGFDSEGNPRPTAGSGVACGALE